MHEQTYWKDLEVNQKKTLRQKQIIEQWIHTGAYGYVTAVTGFGKSFLGKLAIRKCFDSDPNRTVHIIVPTTIVADVWREIIEAEGWTTVHVFTIVAYLNQKEDCDMLIVDEVHRVLNKDSTTFSKLLKEAPTSYRLCLTATLKREYKTFLEEHGLTQVAEVTMQEAEREMYIAPFDLYALKVPLTMRETAELEELNEAFNKAFAHFGRSLDKLNYVRSHNSALREFALELGVEIGVCTNLVRETFDLMRRRSKFLKEHERKLQYALEVVKVLKGKQLLTFSESTQVADTLASSLDNARAYHGKIPTKYFINDKLTKYTKETVGFGRAQGKKIKAVSGKMQNRLAIQAFENQSCNVLCAAKMLDEGANIAGANSALILSFTSQSLQMIQRIGRAIRYEKGKRAVVVMLYMGTSKFKTQERKWLDKATKDVDTPLKKPIYVESIEELRAQLDAKCISIQSK